MTNEVAEQPLAVLFQNKPREPYTLSQQSALSHLEHLLTTPRGSVICDPTYGLPALCTFGEASYLEMSQEIEETIEEHLPQLKKIYVTIRVEPRHSKNTTNFVVICEDKTTREQTEISTRFIDAKWVVVGTKR